MASRTSAGISGVTAFMMLLLPCGIADAQSSAPPQQSAAPQQSSAQSDQQELSAEQLDQLVAPIALYPDALLSEVLMASTYPLEVVEAKRWLDDNKNLKNDALKGAVDKQKWDDSVKALVATPAALDMMNADLGWTQKLGDAVLAQQADIMDAIQRLRTRAQENDKLKSSKEQTVTVKQESGKDVIVIEPTQPDTVYVPYYDPAVVYGAWPYAAYPPYAFPPPPYIAAGVVATGLAFGAGYAVGRWASGGSYWGGGVNWSHNNINVNRPINISGNNIGNRWEHNPVHRQGIRYSNTNVQNRFGNKNLAAGSHNRLDYRGRSGNQVLNPNANRRSGGDRASRNARRPGTNAGRDAGNRNRSAANRGRPAAHRASHTNAFGNMGSGRATHRQSARGRASMGGHARMGGRGGGGHRGGGRRSDLRLKYDIVRLGTLDSGIGFYRFSYIGNPQAYVGVMAQDVQKVAPEAVTTGPDGYLRVHYEQLGLRFESYDRWLSDGGRMPSLSTHLCTELTADRGLYESQNKSHHVDGQRIGVSHPARHHGFVRSRATAL